MVCARTINHMAILQHEMKIGDTEATFVLDDTFALVLNNLICSKSHMSCAELITSGLQI